MSFPYDGEPNISHGIQSDIPCEMQIEPVIVLDSDPEIELQDDPVIETLEPVIELPAEPDVPTAVPETGRP